MIMSKFCGKCGSKLDEQSGRCPVCDKEQFESYAKNKNSKFKRKGVVITLISLIGIIILAASFMLLDYFDIIGIGASKKIGLKSSGTFELYSTSDYLFVSENEQLMTFYCKPPKGYKPELAGDYSAVFVDDGQPGNNGDTKKRDGIYSVGVQIKETTPKTIEVYAIAKDGLKYYESNHLKIEIKYALSDDEQSAIDEVDSSIQELLKDEGYKKSEYKNKIETVRQLLEKLSSKEKSLIREGSVFFDEEDSLYTFVYRNGDFGCVKIDDIDEDNEYLYGESSTDNGTDSQNSSTSSESSHALIMYDWYTDNEEILSIYQEYQRAWSAKGITTNLTQNPTVSQYATQLANNELILIASHGSRWTLKNGWFSSPIKYSVICTHEACTDELDKQYKNDISQKNIVKANTEGGQFYWILPSFFTAHYSGGELDDTILLMDNCNGMGSDGDIDFDLASSMTGESCAAVGFHNSVNIFKVYDRKDDSYYALGYGTNFMKSMAEYLMNGLTFSEAFEKTQKIYGSNQKQYFDNFWGGGKQDDEKVFPMVSGKSDLKLKASNHETKRFKVANQLLSVDSKYIVSDKNAIYLRDCIAENGKKIVDKKNTGQLLSDGETVYFTVSNGYNQANGHEQYDVYSANIFDNSVKKVFSGNYEANLIACEDNAIYYIDEEIPQQGFVTYLATLMKYNLASGNKEVVSSGYAAASACYFKGKIYFSNALLGADLIDRTSVYSYDIKTGKTEEVAKNSTMSKPSYITTNDALYFRTFSCVKGKITNQYLYYINQDGELKKSANFPDNYIVLSVCEDNQTAILREINQNNTYNNYTFELRSGKVSKINSGVSNLFWANNDAKTNSTFLVGYSVNGTSNTRSASVSKLDNGKLVDYNVDDKKYARVYNFDYWIEDGFWVDENMDCHILSRQ